jgi:uracil-DNA glycosylase
MDERIKSIIKDIINCPQIGEYYESRKNNCCEIIDFQKQKDRNNFQLPEPFSGNIDKAKILVISSNPSIDLKKFQEKFPTCQWQENDIIDFFYNRFQKYIKDGTRVLQKDGTYSRAVSFFAHLKNRINEIFAINNSTAEPGIDYCLTEIVHCKSQKEKGVNKAINCCSKYLDRIIQLSPAPLLLIVGKYAEEYIFKRYDLTNNVYQIIYGPEFKVCGPKLIENKERMLYFIQHPAAFGPKLIGKYLENPELKNWINENL